MPSLAITGVPASGKSFVLAHLATLGWRTQSADALAHHVLATNTSVHAALRRKWGAGVFSRKTGLPCRKALAAKVFTPVKGTGEQSSPLTWLENLLHPNINAAWNAQLTQAQAEGTNFAVEIPLLFEKNLHLKNAANEKDVANAKETQAPHVHETEIPLAFTATVCTYASPSILNTRMHARGYTKENAAARMAQQWPQPRKMEAANHVLDTSGTETFTLAQINTLVRQLEEGA